MEAAELQTFVIDICFQSLLAWEACASASKKYYHVANMCFERVLERGRGGSILLRKYVVSHYNMKNIIMGMIKGGCWEWAGRDKRSTRGASLRPLQFCPAGISKLWYILNSKSVDSICQPTIIPSWIGHSFSTFQAVVKGNTKKATEQLCEITQSPLFRFVLACYPNIL